MYCVVFPPVRRSKRASWKSQVVTAQPLIKCITVIHLNSLPQSAFFPVRQHRSGNRYSSSIPSWADQGMVGSPSRPVLRGMVGMARCAIPARVVAGGTNTPATLALEGVAPLHAARTSQRDVPTRLNRYGL